MNDYYLVGLVLTDTSAEERVIATWSTTGTGGITILDCEGLSLGKSSLGMDDIPLFPSLSHLLDNRRRDQRFIFTIIAGQEAMQQLLDLTRQEVEDFSRPGKGILFVLPLAFVAGLN